MGSKLYWLHGETLNWQAASDRCTSTYLAQMARVDSARAFQMVRSLVEQQYAPGVGHRKRLDRSVLSNDSWHVLVGCRV